MAKRISKCNTITPTQVNDAAAAANSTYFGTWRGSSATQQTRIWEVKVTGLSLSASAPMELPLSYTSTLSVGALSAGTGFTDNPMDTLTAALASPVGAGNSAATSGPARSATLQLLDCGINAYGGVFKWQAYDMSFCPAMFGNAVNGGEMCLSLRAGTAGAASAHVIYETQ